MYEDEQIPHYPPNQSQYSGPTRYSEEHEPGVRGGVNRFLHTVNDGMDVVFDGIDYGIDAGGDAVHYMGELFGDLF